MGTIEWINFNPLFSSLLRYPLIVFSNENISFLSLVVCFSLIGCYSFSDDYSFSYTFKIILQDYVNLEIIKKRGYSINPDIHHSKVFSSDCINFCTADAFSGNLHNFIFLENIFEKVCKYLCIREFARTFQK